MRTDLTATLAGCEVRGVVTFEALTAMIGAEKWSAWTEALNDGDPRIVKCVLSEAMKAAGDLKPLEVAREARRLIEEAGLVPCHAFAVRLINDALNKAEAARKNSPAVAATPTPTTA